MCDMKNTRISMLQTLEIPVGKGQPRHRKKCEHGKRKERCPECGTSRCKHGRKKYTCKECKGTSICNHGRLKYRCKTCGGSELCQHGHQKYGCRTCRGTGICEHARLKSRCKSCRGTLICKHGRPQFEQKLWHCKRYIGEVDVLWQALLYLPINCPWARICPSMALSNWFLFIPGSELISISKA